MSDYGIAADTSHRPQGSAWMTTALPAMDVVEKAATVVRRAFAIPLSPPLSPFFSPALSVLSNRSRAERSNVCRQGKEGRGEAHHVFMREGGETDGRRNRGSFPQIWHS